MRAIFNHLIESQELLHHFLEDDFSHQFHSLAFEMQIDEYIEIKLERTDCTDDELVVECAITIENDSLILRITEQTADELEIEMTSE